MIGRWQSSSCRQRPAHIPAHFRRRLARESVVVVGDELRAGPRRLQVQFVDGLLELVDALLDRAVAALDSAARLPDLVDKRVQI
jgi:hypothetical protein